MDLSKVNFLHPVEISTPGVQQRTNREVAYDLSQNTVKMLGGLQGRTGSRNRFGLEPAIGPLDFAKSRSAVSM
jgi:hypothetical protein